MGSSDSKGTGEALTRDALRLDDVTPDALEEAARSLHIPGPAVEQSPLVAFSALLLFLFVSGALVFGFGLSLQRAVQGQNSSPCRPLSPKSLDVPAPDFSVLDVATGQPLTLQELRGKFVVINFWASWCEPCTTEWPQIARLAERFAGRDDIVVLAISQDETLEDVQKFLKRMSLESTTVRVAWDREKTVAKSFGTEKLPDTYFIDRDGALLSAFINVRDWGRPTAYRCVESVAR